MKSPKLLFIVILMLLVTACGPNPIIDDLKTYPEFVKQLVIKEIAFNKAFVDVRAQLKTEPEVALQRLKSDLIPQSSEIQALAQSAQPQTDALKKLHGVLTDAINKRHQALMDLQAALDSKEAAMIEKALAQLDIAIEKFNTAFVEINGFLEKAKLDQ